MSAIVLARIGNLGPHIITTILAIGGVFLLAHKAKLNKGQIVPFIAFAYFLHEAIFQNLFFLVRWFQGYPEALTLFLSYVRGGATEISVGVILVTAYYLRNRLKPSYFAWLPFVALNIVWAMAGYITSLPMGAGPFDNSFNVSLTEEVYTGTFMVGLAGSVL